MKKTIIIIAIVAIILIAGGILLSNNNGGNSLRLETTADMQALIENIYTETEMPLQSLQTNEIDINDEMMLQSFTGLSTNENIEAVVVSEPMMTSQAYSLVMVKTAKNADVEAIKQEMVDNIDTRKWICVTAEKLYATNSGDVIFLVMASEELAKPVYEEFKELANGKIGKELEKEETIDSEGYNETFEGEDLDFIVPGEEAFEDRGFESEDLTFDEDLLMH